jgi:hypothetical protein
MEAMLCKAIEQLASVIAEWLYKCRGELCFGSQQFGLKGKIVYAFVLEKMYLPPSSAANVRAGCGT